MQNRSMTEILKNEKNLNLKILKIHEYVDEIEKENSEVEMEETNFRGNDKE